MLDLDEERQVVLRDAQRFPSATFRSVLAEDQGRAKPHF